MTITTVLTAAFLLGILYGAYKSEATLRCMKSRRDYANLLFEWMDRMPAGPRNEGLTWLAPLVHFMALSFIALATLVLILRQAIILDPAASFGFISGYFHYAFGSASSFLIGHLWGSALPVNPIYKPFRKPAHVGLCAEGILYAGSLFPWKIFTHFTVGESRGVIRLWSAFSPGLVLFPLLPVTAEDHDRLAEALSHYLPTSAAVPKQYPWPGWFLPVIMLGTSGVVVLLAGWLLLSAGITGILATALLMLLFFIFGGRIIMKVSFGGAMPQASLSE